MVVRLRTLDCVLLLLAWIALVSATIGFGDCPTCLPVAIHDAPGIGFDLTAGYGVSSVNIYNGTTKDIVKVAASQEYKDLFVRLSSAPKPQSSFVSSLNRWLNKKRGFPSTKDVGILSDLIIRLKNATEAKLGIGLTKIVLTNPRFDALTGEDLGDAIEYAGLQSWLHVPNDLGAPDQLSENRAALAAHGVNLCQEAGSYQICIEHMSFSVGEVSVYFASLSNSALYTSSDDYLQPYEHIGVFESHVFDSKLGLDSMPEYPSNESYWAAVRDKLIPRNLERPLSNVVVGGEAAMMPEFRAALRDALANVTFRESFDSAIDITTSEHVSPLYSAARGAALLARWRQEAPMGCWEVRDCAARRKHEREGTPYNPTDPPIPLFDFSNWEYSFASASEEDRMYDEL